MHGLESLRSINEHAALKAQDEARRAQGQKPASPTGAVLRKTAVSRARERAAKNGGVPTVRLQGREVALT